MGTRMTFDTAQTQEPAAAGYKGMKASALFSALVGCLGWLPLSSAAEAAPFQQYLNGACSSTSCIIDFAGVPAGRRLEITNASCYLRVSGVHELYAMHLLVLEVKAVQFALTLQPQFVGGVSDPFEAVYSMNHSIFVFANPGQRFEVSASLKKGTFSQLACHISGQTVP